MFRGLFITTLVVGTAIGAAMPARHVAPAAPRIQPTSYGTRETVLNRADNGHFFADGKVNGQSVRFLVDTGATTVVLTRQDAQRIGIDFSPDRFSIIGQGVSGPVLGQHVELGSIEVGAAQLYGVSAVVVADGLGVSLLGQSFLGRLAAVSIIGDEMKLD